MSLLYDGVVFDLDGTLIDTESLCNIAGVETCTVLGLSVPLAYFETLAGVHDAERVRRLAEYTGAPIDPEAFNAEWDRRSYAQFEAGIPLKPGVVALMERISAMGLPIALATSSRRVPAQTKLAATGLDRWFQAVITFEDVGAAKPAPDPYLLAAERLGLAVGRCLAFEDSEPGAQSAHAAGMTVVQIPDMHAASGRFAHHVASDLMAGARAAGLITG